MAYFPERVMPLTPKQNSVTTTPRGTPIDADDFNLLDQEVKAIQEYLLGQGSVPEFSKRVTDLVKEMNQVAYRSSLSNVTSGYCLSGMRLRFPETSCTWLTKLPAPTDREISVNSTKEFPSQGVLSIINDVNQLVSVDETWSRTVSTGLSTVEWVTYDGKTADTFLNCDRGYMGTYAGTHGGYYAGNVNPTSAMNLRDHCPIIPVQTIDKICQRRMSRPYVSSMFPLFDFSGSIDDITRRVMLEGPSKIFYPNNPYLEPMRLAFHGTEEPDTPVTTTDPPTSSIPVWLQRIRTIIDAYNHPFLDKLWEWWYGRYSSGQAPAPTTGVPVTIPEDGVTVSYGIWKEVWGYNADNVVAFKYAYVESEDATARSNSKLTGVEAYDLVTLAGQYACVISNSYDKIDWPEDGIPVFNGRLDVSLSLAAWTNNLTPPSKFISPEAPRAILLADGTALGYLDSSNTFETTAQSVIGYSIKMLPGY